MSSLPQIRANEVLWKLLAPDRVLECQKLVQQAGLIRILDLGCGNHSVAYFKAAFPRCTYTGVDRAAYNNSEEELQSMDSFVRMDLDESSLSAIPDSAFDLVLATHLLEHLRKGAGLIPEMATKLAPGGLMYLAYPSQESVNFPHRPGTLNFYDDPTHITLIRTEAVLERVRESGLVVLSAGVRRRARNLLRGLAAAAASPFLGGVTGPMLWDLYGFEEIVVARRRT